MKWDPPNAMAPKRKPEQCSVCRFSLNADIYNGICRRHAPVVPTSDDPARQSGFPSIAGHGWCGDFERKEQG